MQFRLVKFPMALAVALLAGVLGELDLPEDKICKKEDFTPGWTLEEVNDAPSPCNLHSQTHTTLCARGAT